MYIYILYYTHLNSYPVDIFIIWKINLFNMTSKHYACINGILAYIHCTVSSETIKSDPFAVALTSISTILCIEIHINLLHSIKPWQHHVYIIGYSMDRIWSYVSMWAEKVIIIYFFAIDAILITYILRWEPNYHKNF